MDCLESSNAYHCVYNFSEGVGRSKTKSRTSPTQTHRITTQNRACPTRSIQHEHIRQKSRSRNCQIQSTIKAETGYSTKGAENEKMRYMVNQWIYLKMVTMEWNWILHSIDPPWLIRGDELLLRMQFHWMIQIEELRKQEANIESEFLMLVENSSWLVLRSERLRLRSEALIGKQNDDSYESFMTNGKEMGMPLGVRLLGTILVKIICENASLLGSRCWPFSCSLLDLDSWKLRLCANRILMFTFESPFDGWCSPIICILNNFSWLI